MPNPQKRRGSQAEREVAAILTERLGVKVTRRYNLGTHDDIGDLILPDTTVQVASYADIARAIREKLPQTVNQQERAGTRFGALFCRRRRGDYAVVMTVSQFSELWKAANWGDVVFECRVDESGGLA